ncbi:response regulator transcription factor [Streptomyces sp. NPDC003717]|uniref:response regulator transcription factor n=1 Tax=Streptomyces sp. NPDC003717 TaxID=3154276 RepID=UPI0033A4BF07
MHDADLPHSSASRSGGTGARILIGCGDAVPPERARALCREFLGCDPVTAVSGPELLALARSGAPDLIITVADLPGEDGPRVVRALRDEGDHVPVLIVSRRRETADVVRGFMAGADDYVTWPGDATLLQLRVRALLRRSSWERRARRGGGDDAPTAGAQGTTVGDLTLDEATRTISRAGTALRLTPTEYALLEHFMRHPGQVLSKRQLLEAVWGTAHAGQETLETFVRRLRQKLNATGDPVLHTRRGFGYLLDPGRGPDA